MVSDNWIVHRSCEIGSIISIKQYCEKASEEAKRSNEIHYFQKGATCLSLATLCPGNIIGLGPDDRVTPIAVAIYYEQWDCVKELATCPGVSPGIDDFDVSFINDKEYLPLDLLNKKKGSHVNQITQILKNRGGIGYNNECIII